MPRKNPDYLHDLPTWLHERLKTFDGSLGASFDLIEELANRALLHLPERVELAVSLIDFFDVVEVIMHPTLKAKDDEDEWAWHVYNKYFTLLTAIILHARQQALHEEQIPGTFRFLMAKFHYEKERRSKTLSHGGWHEFDTAIKPLVELGLVPSS